MDTREYLQGLSSDGYKFFGSHKKDKGYIFRLLAPNAKEVHIIGDFNDWQESKLRSYSTGVFSITIKNAKVNDRYQYVITDKNGKKCKKIDPFSRKILINENSSVLTDDTYKFNNKKAKISPTNIYQVHLGSLFKDNSKNKNQILDDLLEHAIANNFTYIKFLPVTEYKNYKSYGFNSIGLFAFTSRYGESKDFKKFIDDCHKNKIGVILDLDFSQFDPDSYYLNDFDGTRLYNYDYDDINYTYHNTINFDPEKNLTKSYLKSCISFWINEFNVDGIALSNIDSMIFWQGDFSRGVNNKFMDLISELIDLIHANKSLALASFNGNYDFDLGFDYVYDYSLRPLIRINQKQPFERNYYKKDIGKIINANNSNKILGFSYIDSFLDEASLAMKMFGSEKSKQMKTIFTLFYSLNSSKMLFMGDEILSNQTFSVYEDIDFYETDKNQSAFNKFYKDLSKIYLNYKALNDCKSITKILDIEGYSLCAFVREFEDEKLLVIINLTDIDYSIKSPYKIKELINSEDISYEGSGNINGNIEKNEKIYLSPYGSAIFKIL